MDKGGHNYRLFASYRGSAYRDVMAQVTPQEDDIY